MSSIDPSSADPGTPSPSTLAEGDRTRRRKRWMWLLAILGLVLVLESGYLVYRVLTDGPTEPPRAQVRVPDFVGRSLADARLIADAVGLELVPTGQVSDQPISTILAQDPRSGTIVVQGSTVAVTIATGAQTVVVPDLVGLPEAEAVGLLAQVGLTVGVRTEAFDPVVAVSSVTGQQPQAGTTVSRGTPVSFVVSRGPGSSPSGSPGPSPTPVGTQTAPPTVGGLVVGDYRCLTLTDATRRLKADGFTLGSVAYTFEGGPVDDTWLVDRQTPTPGERRPRRAAVDLVLSSPFIVCLDGQPS
jgi:beta-lactam-binding protein with PASTA domain